MDDIKFVIIFTIFLSSSEGNFSLLLEREKGGKGERDIDVREKHQLGCLLMHALTRNQTCNPDMCPDWEMNPQPLGPWRTFQPTEPHW